MSGSRSREPVEALNRCQNQLEAPFAGRVCETCMAAGYESRSSARRSGSICPDTHSGIPNVQVTDTCRCASQNGYEIASSSARYQGPISPIATVFSGIATSRPRVCETCIVPRHHAVLGKARVRRSLRAHDRLGQGAVVSHVAAVVCIDDPDDHRRCDRLGPAVILPRGDR
jgi:hypothetical protein